MSVIPTPPNPLTSSSSASLPSAVRVLTCHRSEQHAMQMHQKPGAPSNPIPLAKQRTRSARFVPVPYRTGQDMTSVLWLLPVFPFFSRHVVVRLRCLDRAQGLGSRFLTAPSDTCRMQHATSEIFARAQTPARDDANDHRVVFGGQICYSSSNTVIYPAPRMDGVAGS